MKRLGLFMILAATAGCTSAAGEGSGGINIPQSNYGGDVTVIGGGIGILGAAFYSNVSGGTGEDIVYDFGTDECVVPTTPTTLTYTYVDAGATVTATGPQTLTANKDTSDGITYSVIGTADDNADYTVANSGSADMAASTIGTVTVPAAVVLEGTGEIDVAGDPLDLVWTGGEGASFIQIDVYDGPGTGANIVYTCNAQNDGTFTLDGAVTTAASANGVAQAFAVFYGVGEANGREVLLTGVGL